MIPDRPSPPSHTPDVTVAPARREALPRPYPTRMGQGFLSSARHACRGLVHTVVHQPNMRIHVTAALFVGLVGSGIPLGLAEKVTLIFCVLLVFFAEILNSALEALVDLATRHFDEKARITKDAAAAGVLVLGIGTSVIFAALVVHNWGTVTTHLEAVHRQVVFGLPLTMCAWVMMRSGHGARALDLLAFGVSLVLWAKLLMSSESYVFSAMTLGLLGLTFAAALARGNVERSSSGC